MSGVRLAGTPPSFNSRGERSLSEEDACENVYSGS
jgi:hypothetical protein